MQDVPADEAFVDEARRLLADRDAGAIRAALTRLAEPPEGRDGQLYLARLQIAAGDRATARRRLEQLVARFPGWPPARIDLSRLLQKVSAPQLAWQVLEDGLNRSPRDRNLCRAALKLALQGKPGDKALDRAVALAAAQPTWPPAHILHARILDRMGRPVAAQAVLAAFDVKVPAHAGIAATHAGIQTRLDGPDGVSLVEAELLSAIGRGRAAALATARDCINGGRKEVLFAVLSRLPDPGEDRAGLNIRSELWRCVDAPDRAAALLARLVGVAPDVPAVRLDLARCLEDCGEVDEARTVLDAAIARWPDRFWLLHRRLLIDVDRDPTAIDPGVVADHLDANPRQPAAYKLALRFHVLRDARPAAEAVAARFAAACPEAAAWTALAMLALAEGQPGWSAEAGDRALEAGEIGPDLIKTRALAGLAMRQPDLLEDGLARLETLPETPEAAVLAGRLCLFLARSDEAIGHFREACRRAPGQPEPVWRLARVLAQAGRAAEALELLDDLPVRLRHRPQALASRLRALRALGRHREALDCVADPAVDALPAVVGLKVRLAAQVGHHDAAVATLANWTPRTDAARADHHSAAAAVALARFDLSTAAEHLEHAIRLAPGDARLRHQRAELRLIRFDPRGTLADLDTANGLRRREGMAPRRIRGGLYGEIANELVLDGDTTEALARMTRDGAAPEAFAAMVRDTGAQSTGAAMALLIALRRAGRLCVRPGGGGPGAIPPVIVQYWEGEAVEPALEAAWDGLRARNPWAGYRRFDAESAREWLRDNAPEACFRAFRLCRHPAARADLFRLALLAAEGGVHVDADDICTGDLAALIPPGAGLVFYQEHIGSIGNNFIAARPGHPVIEALRDEVSEAVLSGAGESIWLKSGPGAFSRAVAGVIARSDGLDAGPDIAILARHDLLRVLTPTAPFAYKLDRRNWMLAESG